MATAAAVDAAAITAAADALTLHGLAVSVWALDRLGCRAGGAKEVKRHDFFCLESSDSFKQSTGGGRRVEPKAGAKWFDFNGLLDGTLVAPYTPPLESKDDLSHFGDVEELRPDEDMAYFAMWREVAAYFRAY